MADDQVNPLNNVPSQDAGASPQVPQSDAGAAPQPAQDFGAPAASPDGGQGGLSVDHPPADTGATQPQDQAGDPGQPLGGPQVDAPVEGGDTVPPAPEEPTTGGSDQQTPGQV
jgi:hypothetical protein